jgi:hypothetical protein
MNRLRTKCLKTINPAAGVCALGNAFRNKDKVMSLLLQLRMGFNEIYHADTGSTRSDEKLSNRG